ncbi:PREDICTED: DNA-3-methyladenine glycosylase-like [Nicrophorus vespilloides]|uniref:DNA-3-methyladenine glycosylase II n=1 Tax=Nicrophorus vespilloides TaxID=110193 RepID=A0ABM1N3T1_NICVS|nr:PREDICTED: DNA-3-methyladenine glycosylase-like [Nicrophorus vespilloides]
MTKRLGQSFYNVSSKELAISLLGKILVRQLDTGETLKGRIVEIESYPSSQDIFSNQKENNEPIKPGTSLVCVSYGLFWLNISSNDPNGVVVIRAIEPIVGVKGMMTRRNRK